MVEVCLTLTLTPKIEESLSPSERAITATQISSNTIKWSERHSYCPLQYRFYI